MLTPKAKYQQAGALFAKKEYDAALALLDELLEAFPDNADSQRVRAKVVHAMERQAVSLMKPSGGTPRSTPNRKAFLWACAAVCVACLGAATMWLLMGRGDGDDNPGALTGRPSDTATDASDGIEESRSQGAPLAAKERRPGDPKRQDDRSGAPTNQPSETPTSAPGSHANLRDQAGQSKRFPSEVTDYVGTFPTDLRGFASEDWRVKHATLEKLVRKGSSAIPLLTEGLRLDYRPHVSDRRLLSSVCVVGEHCAIALGRIGDQRAGAALLEAMDSPDRDTRREVIRALGALRINDGIPALVATWTDPTEDKTNKREAALSLARIGKAAVPAVVQASIQGEQERLATATLLKIALQAPDSVRQVAEKSHSVLAKRRAEAALTELRRRTAQWDDLPDVANIEKMASEHVSERRYADAVALWEQVLDSGLYTVKEDVLARRRMLELKSKTGRYLLPESVAVWRNKVFVLRNYDADLIDEEGNVVRHVQYSLSPSEIDVIRQRFMAFTQCVYEGSCGALKIVNDIEVIEEPWTRLWARRVPSGGTSWHIPRSYLNEAFDFEQKCPSQGYHCVFFQLRSDGVTFKMEGGGAAGASVVNAQSRSYDSVDIAGITHEWLHILHATIWNRGNFDWMQCIPLHDQFRDVKLEKAWQTGATIPEQETYMACMRQFITARMWLLAGAQSTSTFADCGRRVSDRWRMKNYRTGSMSSGRQILIARGST